THAVAEQGGIPRIELADRALYLPELYARHIPANLVILGACQTGIGELSRGEGVMSLASGFAYAGVSSLIGSLWKVREEAAEQVLSDFYGNVLTGQHKAAALCQAKRQYLAQSDKVHSNPYYWAAFVYVGADGPLELQEGSLLWVSWLLGGVVLGAFFFFYVKRRKVRDTSIEKNTLVRPVQDLQPTAVGR
ncbi:MAG: CHAT domain-containing protein, partial [Phaeodactylibacter sp.]|nr:CHAT domain-containing protein [Phaeodactylibacter sp.]